MAKKAETDRKTRILDAAEQAFAEHGFEGASLRQIVLDAKVNLATVYYYFESKEGLMAAVIARRFDPLRQAQIGLLEQYETEAQGQPLPLEKILDVMLVPLRQVGTNSAKSRAIRRLMGRIVTEPNPQFQDILRPQHEKVRAAYLRALQRSLPDLPMADIQWRIEFFWGALAFILCNPRKIEKMSGGACNPADTPTALAQLMTFFATGFRAPAVAPAAT